MFSGAKPPPKPVIRKITVQKAPTPAKANGNKQANGTNVSLQRRPVISNGKEAVTPRRGVSGANGLLKPHASKANGTRRADSKSSEASRRGGSKRKAPSPSLATRFDSTSDENENEKSDEGVRKRARPSPRPGNTLEKDLNRTIFGVGGPEEEVIEADWPLLQGEDMTSGKEKEFTRYFPAEEGEEDEAQKLVLKYPSRWSTERFQLVIPHESEGYRPIEDMIQSIEHICKYYFDESTSARLTDDDNNGLTRRVKRYFASKSFPEFAACVSEFNLLIEKTLSDNTLQLHLRTVHALPLDLIERILSQVYSRTVSPEVNILKQYENGTDNVYGELLPRFTHQIFSDTNLRSDSVFVDLGSGVGNVVLQAALQTGCESWGIEQMPNPARLARAQQSEFESRCKRWNVRPGHVSLIEGDFLINQTINAALKRADVVLVNNQAFTPDLNTQLVYKFLDLKDGCKVVSLKSFLPNNWKLTDRNAGDPRNMLHPVLLKRYWSDSVSWTDQGGTYFVATKKTLGGPVTRRTELDIFNMPMG